MTVIDKERLGLKKNNMKDCIYIDLKGLNLWIKEKDYYSRGKNIKTCIAIADRDNNNTSTEYAKGKVLIIASYGFNQYYEGTFFKKNDVNEISSYIRGIDAIKLAEFILKHREELL